MCSFLLRTLLNIKQYLLQAADSQSSFPGTKEYPGLVAPKVTSLQSLTGEVCLSLDRNIMDSLAPTILTL